MNLDRRKPCPYGRDCYRKNPLHFEEYSHPAGHNSVEFRGTYTPKDSSSSSTASAWSLASDIRSQYGLYLFRIRGLKYGVFPTITLQEILNLDHDKLESSAQFNYMFDIDWLLEQYPTESRSLPLLLVHGFQGSNRQRLKQMAEKHSNVNICEAHIRLPYGVHHTKMMLLKYQDGLRIIIHTANMIPDDWGLRTQGVWISPKLLPTTATAKTDSITHFRADLIEYIGSYGTQVTQGPSGPLSSWIDFLKKHDFTPIKVYLVGSVSGSHTGSDLHRFGHPRIAQLLRKNHVEVPSSWPLIGQFSSIGSLGAQPTTWVTTEWSSSMAGRGARGIRLIYPCVEDVRNSLEGYGAGGCLPYTRKTADRQPWLRQFFHQWRSHGRNRAAPHIKSYLRMSPDGNQVAWFLLTSANLSKAAWGAYVKDGTQLMIRSYELGVLFIPSIFQTDTASFEVLSTDESDGHTMKRPKLDGESGRVIPFPVPYDLPPVQYSEEDEPWIVDRAYSTVDIFGRTWKPGL